MILQLCLLQNTKSVSLIVIIAARIILQGWTNIYQTERSKSKNRPYVNVRSRIRKQILFTNAKNYICNSLQRNAINGQRIPLNNTKNILDNRNCLSLFIFVMTVVHFFLKNMTFGEHRKSCKLAYVRKGLL